MTPPAARPREAALAKEPGMRRVVTGLVCALALAPLGPAWADAVVERLSRSEGIYTEVKSLKATAPEPARFEVPAGFTRK
jgi:hypothetical protein